MAQQAAGLATVVRQAQRGYAAVAASASEAFPNTATHANGPLEYDVAVVLDDRSAELESLSNDALYGALRIADEQLVQRSLAASSERFVKRVSKLLGRRDAKRLRQLLRRSDPRGSPISRLATRVPGNRPRCETATAGRR